MPDVGLFLWRLAGRLVLVPTSALIGSVVIFSALHSLPGDPVARESHQTPLQYEQAMHRLGLDLPLPVQYVRLMARIANGDLARILQPEAALSGKIGFLAAVIAIGLGVGIGLTSARKANTATDRILISLALAAYSVPNFVWAFLMVFVGVTVLYYLTAGVFYYDPNPCCQGLQIFMPAFALGIPFAGYVARHTRTAIVEERRRDYATTARAKGLDEEQVIRVHVLRNAGIIVLTVVGPVATALITGSLVIEQAFAVPGLGHELIQSILSRNYTTAVGVFVYYVLLIGIANLIVDVLYPLLDPRLSL
jgi:ABC-type dipeptide/oligopeptide/nickel transport system permease component